MNDSTISEMIPVPPAGFMGLSREEWTWVILFIVWLEPKVTRFVAAWRTGNNAKGALLAAGLGSAFAPNQDLTKQPANPQVTTPNAP